MIDQEDSNRSDRSDYDYPQEDYHQDEDDNSSQGIIEGRKGKNRRKGSDDQFDEDSDNLNNSY